MNKIDLALVPHLRTGVGIHGSLKQQEVGGAACVAAAIALVSGGGPAPANGMEPVPPVTEVP